MVKINAPFDSDQHPKAVLLQGDDIAESYCGQCLTPAKDWPHQAARHGNARPGVMFQAELFCAGCRGWAEGAASSGERRPIMDGVPTILRLVHTLICARSGRRAGLRRTMHRRLGDCRAYGSRAGGRNT